jgi:hypothetical protein
MQCPGERGLPDRNHDSDREIADLMLFLASPASGLIAGQTISRT